jgi:hypothetical protein
MAYPTTRRWVAVAAMAAALLALTACGKDSASGSGTDNGSGSGLLGGAASPSPDLSATGDGAGDGTGGGNPGGGGGGGSAPAGPTYPNDAKSYGLEILKAIGNKDNARLAALVDLSTVNYAQQYQNNNAQWTYTDCASGATQMCHYYNQTGDIASVGILTAKLGQTQAGSSVYVEGGSYPTNASGYVLAFGSSWESGAYAKMVALSSNSIADHYKGVAKFSSVNAGITAGTPKPCATNASKMCVDLSQVGGTATLPAQHLIVDMAKIGAGKPNGIIGYE